MKIIPENYSAVISIIDGLKSSDSLTIDCAGCGEPVVKNKSRIQAAIKHGKSLYCTSKCGATSKSVERLRYECLTCGTEVFRRETEVRGNVFCNSSCAATYNNTVAPKREKGIHYVNGKKTKAPALKTKDGVCSCGKPMWRQSTQCNQCRTNAMKEKADEDYLAKTFGDFKASANNVSHIYYIYIRAGSRRIAKRRGMEKVCKVCGYDTYAELCHIKDISKFPDEATMAEVNSPENLVYLCPNHHKELHLGVLEL